MASYNPPRRRSWRRHKSSYLWLTNDQIPLEIRMRLIKTMLGPYAEDQQGKEGFAYKHVNFDEELPTDIAIKIAKLVQKFVR